MAPGVSATVRHTAPLDSCTTASGENAHPRMTSRAITHRAPDPRGRTTTTTFASCPPSSCQLDTRPARTALSSARESAPTPASRLMMGTTARRPSPTARSEPAGMPAASGGKSEAPKSTRPAAAASKPANDPPPLTCTVVPGTSRM